MIYAILIAHTALLFVCVLLERSRLKCKFIGPLSVAVCFTYLPNLVGRCGVVSYTTSISIVPDLILFGANLLLVTIGLVTYSMLVPKSMAPLINLNHKRSVAPFERGAFNRIFYIILVLFIISIALILKRISDYGFSALLADAAEYHNWEVENASANTVWDNGLQVLVGAGPLCLGFALVIWSWFNISGGQKLLGAFVISFICIISFFTSRAVLVMATVPTLLVMFFSGALLLSKSRKVYFYGALFAAAFIFITIRRATYLGDESAFVLLKYFGISSTVLSDSFVSSRLGQVFLTVVTYISAPYSNFCGIINNHEELQLTYGIMSSRIVNPLLSIISPGIADIQRSALYANTDILLASSNGGSQWSMVYGPAFLDFGFVGPFIYAIAMGLLLPFCTVKAAKQPPARSFLILYIVFFIAFTFFQMPPLAPHHGVFLCLALVSLIVIYPEIRPIVRPENMSVRRRFDI